MQKQPILKLAIAAVVIAGFNIAAAMYTAGARPSTKSYTCKGVQNLVHRRGAIVMNHKSSSLYQRFVRNVRFCRGTHNTTERFRVPTKTGACYLRICAERDYFFRD